MGQGAGHPLVEKTHLDTTRTSQGTSLTLSFLIGEGVCQTQPTRFVKMK